MAKILIPDGGEADVNQPVAVAAESKEDVPKFANYKAEQTGAAAAAAAPKPAAAAQATAAPTAAASSSSPVAAQQTASATSDSRVIASPLAKKLAERAGISLKGVAGTGPNNRITKADVDAILAARMVAASCLHYALCIA